MRTKALGAKAPRGTAARARAPSSGTYAAMHSPPVIAVDVFRNSRRPTFLFFSRSAEVMTPASHANALPLRKFPRHDEWHGEYVDKFRSDRCCRTSLHRYLRR